MKKYVNVVIIVLLVLVILSGAWLASALSAKKYSVVYLASREIYIGRLHTFPRLMLEDAYVLQALPADNTVVAEGTTKPTQELFPLSGKAWAPEKIYLNRDQILFYGPLSENSESGKAIREKQLK